MTLRQRKRLIDQAVAMLPRGQCQTYPACPCGRRWRCLSKTFASWPEQSEADWEWTKLSFTVMVACLAAHCPDPADRRDAQEAYREMKRMEMPRCLN